jgi:hypothetical protein
LKILFKEAVKNKVRLSISGYEETMPINEETSKQRNLGWNLELPVNSK